MPDCLCDPEVWGPEGLERGNGHNPACRNAGAAGAARSQRTSFDLYEAEPIGYGLGQPGAFVRHVDSSSYPSTYRSELSGPTVGTIGDWTPEDVGRLCVITLEGVTLASFIVGSQ